MKIPAKNIYFFKFPLINSLGGAELHTFELAKKFQSWGYQTKLFTSDPKLFRLFEKNHLPRVRMFVGYEPTSKLSLLLWPFTYFVAHWKFAKLLKSIPAGSVLFMQSLTEKLVLTKLAFGKHKIFWLEHKIPGRWLKHNPLLYSYMHWGNKTTLVTVSQFAKNAFVKLGMKKERIKVIYPAVTSKRTKDLSGKPDSFTIGLLSRLAPEKGIQNFIKLIIPKLREHQDWQLVIAGEGEDLPKIREFITTNHLSKRIKLLGFINDLDEFFSQISVFAYPSIVPESFGMAVYEAASRGIPVVASKQGGISELIGENQADELVPPDKFENFLQSLERLYHTLAGDYRIKEAPAEKINLTTSKMFEQFADLIEKQHKTRF